jgi:hypothetical protein
MFSNEEIKKFQKIYKDYFGYDINQDEAFDNAKNLVRLFELIIKK